MMIPTGKGFFIWKIVNCEGGDPVAIADEAQLAGLRFILIKIADGVSNYNIDSATGRDLVPPLIAQLRLRAIEPWGWQYIYGYDPVGEANRAIQRLNQLNLTNFAIDAEGEFKQPGKDQAATTYMNRLRAGLPGATLALCSYRYPSYHPQFPWRQFLDKCDLNMPQVYWINNHNPGEQLARSVNEFQGLVPFRPIVPVGAAFKSGSWQATPSDETVFLQTARTLNLTGASFWEWANCRTYLPENWVAIKNYNWPTTPPPLDIAQQYIQALNTHNPDEVIKLYIPNAVHVTASQTVSGTQAIRNWYANFFQNTLPNAVFSLSGYNGSGNSRYLTWTARSPRGVVNNGSDTLGLLNDDIAYHYTFFTVSPPA